MPRLIRLTTDDDNGYFSNDFKEDIIIKPYSKMALYNLSAEIRTSTFELTAANNAIEYQLSALAPIRKINLTPDIVYNGNNINDLFYDMTIKLNEKMEINRGSEYGRQWKVDLFDKKVRIRSLLSPSSEYNGIFSSQNVQSLSGGEYRRNGGVVGDYDSFIYWNRPLSKGTTAFKYRFKTEPISEGILFGVSESPFEDGTALIQESKIKHGLLVNDLLNYEIYQDGIKGPPQSFPIGFAIDTNDEMFFEISEGKINFHLYKSDNTDIILASYPYTNNNLYPFIVLVGDFETDNVSINNLRVTLDPYLLTTTEESLTDNLLSSPNQSNVNSRMYFQFTSLLFAQFLGFDNVRYPVSGTVLTKDLIFSADNQFNPSDLSESYIVELLNINLQSYDSAIKQRRNILNTIVNTTENNDRITYESNYPLYIDMNNAQPLTLRNIRARILKEDGSNITIDGFAQMTVLID